MAGDMMLLLVVRLELAEELHGRLELVGREVLIPNDQHVMIDESLVQPVADLRINRLAAIEPAHLGAGVIR